MRLGGIIGICVLSRLEASVELSLFWGAVTLTKEPIRLQFRRRHLELWVLRAACRAE